MLCFFCLLCFDSYNSWYHYKVFPLLCRFALINIGLHIYTWHYRTVHIKYISQLWSIYSHNSQVLLDLYSAYIFVNFRYCIYLGSSIFICFLLIYFYLCDICCRNTINPKDRSIYLLFKLYLYNQSLVWGTFSVTKKLFST